MTGSLYSAPSNHLRRGSFYGNCSHESESVTSYQLCTSGRCTLSPILLLLSVKMDSLHRRTRAAAIFPIADLKASIRTWKDWAEVPRPSISDSETKESKVKVDLMTRAGWDGAAVIPTAPVKAWKPSEARAATRSEGNIWHTPKIYSLETLFIYFFQ